MSLENIRLFAISKLEWIKKHQSKLLSQERESPREYLERESRPITVFVSVGDDRGTTEPLPLPVRNDPRFRLTLRL
ncbi:hypothetical protein [Sinorhizobium sp. 8-89]|uniref:hypothetical protein n=1 Tax=Sinorhizobium sp. 8-89 TaxID=3049089 RepID=UPI00386B5190